MNSDVVVVGAGLAGLSAAVALAEDGARVTLVERRPQIGGRAYSYLHPALEETVDSQHVVLGCCTNLLDLCAKAGASENIRWYDELTFLEPNGNRSLLRPGSLPAPGHQTLSFLQAPMLTLADKAGIARGMLEFLRGYPASDAGKLRHVAQSHQADRARHPPLLGAGRRRRAERTPSSAAQPNTPARSSTRASCARPRPAGSASRLCRSRSSSRPLLS